MTKYLVLNRGERVRAEHGELLVFLEHIQARPQTEWLLAPNTKYLLRVTNVSGGAVSISAAVGFYEHDEE